MDELSKSKPAKSFLTPLVPRGHLDITFRDLSYALLQCLKYILSQACLAADSCTAYYPTKKEATDLKTTHHKFWSGFRKGRYLIISLVHSFPAEAEIIIVPPVNIPGMVDVIRYHNLSWFQSIYLHGRRRLSQTQMKQRMNTQF
ncbi:hypothetical protein QTG54_000869 [Skeletonema marinoi]|uniref:Uncharacterized protein n=1 Tax=Skeletonema marinoi TaxID=267567 RepID=A0AAD8YNX8_9STRA|nr:hypothetical protein QTG54_000869 [Skeletonema marinoi]